MQRFRSKILKVGVNPYVDVPGKVSEFFGGRGYVPVVVSVGGGEVRSTLVPVGGGLRRLYINGAMRRLASVDVGEWVSVGLVRDTRSTMPAVPGRLRQELRRRPGVRRVWEQLTPSRRKEILRYLTFAKRPETLARNVDRLLRILGASARGETLSGIKIHGPR